MIKIDNFVKCTKLSQSVVLTGSSPAIAANPMESFWVCLKMEVGLYTQKGAVGENLVEIS